MNCYLCGSIKYREILDKPAIYIWTNAGEPQTDRKKYKCILRQCQDCGHIYQPVDSDLRNTLKGIYSSKQAQLSTPMGKGNWGDARARNFFQTMQMITDFKKHKSAVEIGCADGYLSKFLKNNGFEEVIGIDPSIDRTEEMEGVLFLRAFAGEKLKLHRKYDLIFSVGVFEHIEEIDSMIKFCKNNLSEEGELFFCVPDAKRQLANGDPALFTHQHIHYYTEESIVYLLLKHGFKIKSLLSRGDSLSVSAKITKTRVAYPTVIFYNDYQKQLVRVLIRVESILQCSNVIVHGVNNALNNILGWIGKDFNFILLDNDNTKHSKRYFNKVVNCLDDIILSGDKRVLIIPTVFYEIIKKDYVNKGFSGKIESLI